MKIPVLIERWKEEWRNRMLEEGKVSAKLSAFEPPVVNNLQSYDRFRPYLYAYEGALFVYTVGKGAGHVRQIGHDNSVGIRVTHLFPGGFLTSEWIDTDSRGENGEERIMETYDWDRVDGRIAWQHLLNFHVNDRPSWPHTAWYGRDGYEEGDEDAPFFSEKFLYNLIGKDDARTLLALIRRVGKAIGRNDG